MKRIAKFQKVSYEQFTEGWIDTFGATNAEEIKTIYDHIKLPKRATSGSAGYDFYAPVTLTLKPGNCESSYRNPCGDGRKLGSKMLSEKWAWIQISSAIK